ncbi:VOC family protein [Ramlibacter sp.]|uniref:VOC family protein n=1 Tax=Ramlibacter sp. TaxID=1917967 RepID=UPI002CCD0FD5|nr:VOC family protein [Ramlibacter sp.]HWI82645.1 VOC family protein [Ramlibacter sp.]
MLSASSITTMLPVKDIQRARAFYEGKLGFVPEGPRPDGKFLYRCAGGATIALFPKPEGTKAEHTAVSFEVADIAGTVRELERSGVVFEDYDLPDLRTVGHVCVLGSEKAAWFRDTEGNYLCLHEDVH